MNEIDLDASPGSDELQGVLSNAVDAVLAVPPPTVDIDDWRKRHPSALAWLNPQRIGVLSQRRKYMQRVILLAATTAAAVCAWLGTSLFHPAVTEPGATAFGATFESIANQIENAPTITWTSIEYLHATSRDGKATWLVKDPGFYTYRLPGLTRSVLRDVWRGGGADQSYEDVTITDGVRGRSIELYPEKKQATITDRDPMPASHFKGAPFGQFLKILREGNLEWVERLTLSTGNVVNIFRSTVRDENNDRYRSQDFWIDAKSKRLVAINFNGSDGEFYNPEKDPLRNNPVGKDPDPRGWSHRGTMLRDIVFDAKVDDSLFSLKAPEGYSVKHERASHVTEQEMLDCLGVFVEFNDRAFPHEAFPAHHNFDKKDAALGKPASQQTAIEKKYVAMSDRYVWMGTPFDFFRARFSVTNDFVEDSFRYLGKGVKLGEKDRIVCWYKLKNAKDANTYRVVYGDLSVKDVAAKDLPLPVGP
jgi:hypothetical protein